MCPQVDRIRHPERASFRTTSDGLRAPIGRGKPMFLAAILKEHADSANAAELNSSAISHDETTTVEVTGVVAVPEDFLGVPAVNGRGEPRTNSAPASRARWA